MKKISDYEYVPCSNIGVEANKKLQTQMTDRFRTDERFRTLHTKTASNVQEIANLLTECAGCKFNETDKNRLIRMVASGPINIKLLLHTKSCCGPGRNNFYWDIKECTRKLPEREASRDFMQTILSVAAFMLHAFSYKLVNLPVDSEELYYCTSSPINGIRIVVKEELENTKDSLTVGSYEDDEDMLFEQVDQLSALYRSAKLRDPIAPRALVRCRNICSLTLMIALTVTVFSIFLRYSNPQ